MVSWLSALKRIQGIAFVFSILIAANCQEGPRPCRTLEAENAPGFFSAMDAGGTAILGEADQTIKYWDLQTGNIRIFLQPPPKYGRPIALSSNKKNALIQYKTYLSLHDVQAAEERSVPPHDMGRKSTRNSRRLFSRWDKICRDRILGKGKSMPNREWRMHPGIHGR